MFLERLLGRPREYVIAHDDTVLSRCEWQTFIELLQRRSAGEPMAYLIGHREFFGLGFEINHKVLIPRPETEWLVQAAITLLPRGATAVDLGTGSGAIAVSLAFHRSDAKLIACDISGDALSLAGKNAKRLLGQDHAIDFICSDWWQSVPEQPIALALANPPYLAFDDPHLLQGDLRFEPRVALSDERDGLSAIEAIIEGFARRAELGWIEDPGILLIEHGYQQANAVQKLGEFYGLVYLLTAPDAAGHPRVCCLAVNHASSDLADRLKDVGLTWSSRTA